MQTNAQIAEPARQPSAENQQVEELKAEAKASGIAFVASVSDDMLDPSLVGDLPVEWARANCLLPVRVNGENCVLTCDPDNVTQQEDLALLIGAELRPILAARDVIVHSIERCYYSKEDSPKDFLNDIGSPEDANKQAHTEANDLLQVASKAPVTQLINLILLEAVKRNASDIHFEPFESRMRVRYRMNGVLYEQTAPPKHLEDALVSRLKVMARMDIAERRLPQDGMARVRVGEREIDIRVSTVPVAEGERVVLRLLDRDSSLLPLEALGMSADTQRQFDALLAHANGIIMVSGPTGSGKTTTLYAALGKLNASRKNIMTIEDPIEYQLPDIGQMQVKPKIGLTFANGLRHILRQDPDVVLVGETRDIETAEIAMRASLTGHLVFTTLHANDAPGTVLRLVDMGIEPYLLASCLRGVLAQRLVRKLCDRCKKEEQATPRDRDSMASFSGKPGGETIWTAQGCEACIEGYSGRTGLFELMEIDARIQDIVRAGNTNADDLRARAIEQGMISLQANGVRKVLCGTTTLSELLSVSGP